MPPRPPPSPRVLTVLCAAAAIAAAWVALSAEQAIRVLAARAAGLADAGLAISAARGWTLAFVSGAAPTPGVGAWVVAAGTGGMIAGALLLAGLVFLVRSPGWLRAFGLELFAVALLWTPTALAAAVTGAGGGPAAELYAGLGEPPAGRWAALGLALVLLVLVAGPIARRAVAVGRAWMRVDGRDFRLRVVRVTAGWPSLAALAGIGVVAEWAAPAVLLAWLAAIMVVLHVRID